MERPYVLIAHHNERIRTSLIEFVERIFDVIGVVINGEELVEVARLLHPDVIVSDITMPLIDGLAARDKLIAHGLAVPFVFVTGLERDVVSLLPSEFEVEDEPPVAFVYKNDIPQHLVSAVEAVLAGRQYISPYYRV